MAMTPLSIVSPPVSSDTSGVLLPLLVNTPTLSFIVETPPNACYVEVQVAGASPATFQSTQALYVTPYISSAVKFFFNINVSLGPGVNRLTLLYYTVLPSDTAESKLAAQSLPLTLEVTLDQVSQLTSATPPTAFDLLQRSLDVQVTWDPVATAGLLGYNFYLSNTPGGPYYKVNTAPITAYDPSAPGDAPRILFTLPLSAIPVAYQGSSYNAAAPFYAVVSTLISYPSGGVLESAYSMEFEVKFYTFPSDYTSPINRNESDIRNSILQSIHSYDMAQDIKPGSILQDVFVNPVSTELGKAYQRLHFYHFANALSTLIKYEDENDDGIPDTLNQSPLRQQLLLAFNLASTDDVQAWIDQAFDRLASRYVDARKGSRNATGLVTFYTSVMPVQTLVIPQGTQVSSNILGATQTTFVTLETVQIPLTALNAFYNQSLARWEVKAHVQAIQAGADGNALAGSINSVSGLPGGLSVVNMANLSGGLDRETNLELAARVRNAFLARDTGRSEGIKSWVNTISGIYSCSLVGAGDPYMMRDYDQFRKKHVYGRADVYVDSHAISERTQTMVMIPSQVSTGVMTTLTATTTDFTLTLLPATATEWSLLFENPLLTSKYPPFSIRVFNKTLPPDTQEYTITSWYYSSLTNGSVTVHLNPDPNLRAPLPGDVLLVNMEVPIMESGSTGTSLSLVSSTSSTCVLKVLDGRLSPSTPVYQLSFVRNITGNFNYDVTGWSTQNLTMGSVEVVLPISPSQPSPLTTDELDIQFYILYSPGFQFTTQPVLSINSIMGEQAEIGGAGAVDVQSTFLVSPQDPLGLGNSTHDTKSLVIQPSSRTQQEPVTFVPPNPLDPTAIVDMTYTATVSGVLPLYLATPTLVDNFNPTNTLLEGLHYTLEITSDQRLRITRTEALSAVGSYTLNYQTYVVFPRKFKVVGEPIVLQGTTPAYLTYLGVDIDAESFQITLDLEGTRPLVRYGRGSNPNYRLTPFDNAGVVTASSSSPYDADYWAAQSSSIIGASSSTQASFNTPVGIINTNLSEVPDGSTVYVSYEYFENISVKYSVDQGVIDAQSQVDSKCNITSNILVKRCNYVPTTIEMSVTLNKTADVTTVESAIRAGVSTIFDALEVNQGVPESEIIRVVKSVAGVSNVHVPLARMSYADGAMILQEPLPLWETISEASAFAPTYVSQTSSVYTSIANGGYAWQYVAVYEGGIPLTRTFSKETLLNQAPGTSGLFFLELGSDYHLRVYIKPYRDPSQNPDINTYTHSMTYYVYGDNSTHDLPGENLSILTLANLSLTFVSA